MTLIIVMSVIFLVSPIVGYVLISVDLSLQKKLMIGAVLGFLLTVSPIVVMIFTGGSGGS